MNIQEYSELVALIAKIESKRVVLSKFVKEADAISDEQGIAYKENDEEKIKDVNDRWLAAYEKLRIAERSLVRAYKEFRKKIDTDEYRYFAHMFAYSVDKSDRNFYYIARRNILEKGIHIEFESDLGC